MTLRESISMLEKQINIVKEIKGHEEEVLHAQHVLESARWFAHSDTMDSDNFDGYCEMCREDLDALLGVDDVEETIQLLDLFKLYFGDRETFLWSQYEWHTIYEKIVMAHINSVMFSI